MTHTDSEALRGPCRRGLPGLTWRNSSDSSPRCSKSVPQFTKLLQLKRAKSSGNMKCSLVKCFFFLFTLKLPVILRCMCVYPFSQSCIRASVHVKNLRPVTQLEGVRLENKSPSLPGLQLFCFSDSVPMKAPDLLFWAKRSRTQCDLMLL